MPISAQYDREADALYVRLQEGEQTRAIEVDDTTYVDIDAEGRPVGIELLYPSTGIDLKVALRRFRLQEHEPAILSAIAHAGAGVTVPTYTGGSRMASATVQTMAIEGTVGASAGMPAFSVAKPDKVLHARG